MTKLPHQSYSEWLVLRCQLGEPEAFEQLVELWRQSYFLYALNRLNDREAAQDATQDCLLAISRSIGKLSDPAAFPKWSFRILERRCFDWLRKTIREREKLKQNAVEADSEIDFSNAMETKLTVGQLLEMLDPKLATLLRLYYLESFSLHEIAEIANVPVGTVKSRLFYARKLLGNILNN